VKKITDILGQLLLIAKDAGVWFRVLVFVIVGTICVVIGAVQFSKTKVKKEDCTYYIEQNKTLISALIDIKKELQPAQHTSFAGTESNFIFASFDTVPKKQTQKQVQQMQQAQVRKVLSKIDSVLLNIVKQDSVKKKQLKN